MFLNGRTVFHGSVQKVHGKFLIFMQPDLDGRLVEGGRFDIRCAIASVTYEQCGNFMMGQATVAGHKLTLSGAYGADGLPKSVPTVVWGAACTRRLPDHLREAWSKGGGWNGAGSEATAVREWALRAPWPHRPASLEKLRLWLAKIYREELNAITSERLQRALLHFEPESKTAEVKAWAEALLREPVRPT